MMIGLSIESEGLRPDGEFSNKNGETSFPSIKSRCRILAFGTPSYTQEDAFIHGALAGHLERMGRHEEAEAAYRRAVAILEKAAADFPDKTTFSDRLESVRRNLAEVLSNQGKDADAKALREAAMSTSRPK